MKLTFIIAIIFIFFAPTSEAQIFKKLQEKLEDKVEKKADDVLKKTDNKADRKVDQTIDDVLNKTEDKVSGKDKKKKTADNSKSTDSDEELSIDDITSMKGNPYENADKNPPSTTGAEIFKKGGESRNDYNFSHYMKIRTRVSAPSAMATTTTYDVHFGVSPTILSISDLKLSNSSAKSYTLDRFVYDIERKALFTYTTEGQKKSYMGLEYDAQALADDELNRSSYLRVQKVTKTDKSKMIAGYMCDAYKCEAANMDAMVWVSQSNGLNPYDQLNNILNSTSTGGKDNMPIFYNYKILKERLQAGAMVLAYELTDKKHNKTTEMLVLSFGNKPSSFNATPYMEADKQNKK